MWPLSVERAATTVKFWWAVGQALYLLSSAGLLGDWEPDARTSFSSQKPPVCWSIHSGLCHCFPQVVLDGCPMAPHIAYVSYLPLNSLFAFSSKGRFGFRLNKGCSHCILPSLKPKTNCTCSTARTRSCGSLFSSRWSCSLNGKAFELMSLASSRMNLSSRGSPSSALRMKQHCWCSLLGTEHYTHLAFRVVMVDILARKLKNPWGTNRVHQN